jgi:hypothetical protein
VFFLFKKLLKVLGCRQALSRLTAPKKEKFFGILLPAP